MLTDGATPVRARLAPFAERNPACFAGHDDFIRFTFRFGPQLADAGEAGIDRELSSSA
jgi:hypothetical protein